LIVRRVTTRVLRLNKTKEDFITRTDNAGITYGSRNLASETLAESCRSPRMVSVCMSQDEGLYPTRLDAQVTHILQYSGNLQTNAGINQRTLPLIVEKIDMTVFAV
jgi:hypothetical protein